jgi:hypothetical protein
MLDDPIRQASRAIFSFYDAPIDFIVLTDRVE